MLKVKLLGRFKSLLILRQRSGEAVHNTALVTAGTLTRCVSCAGGDGSSWELQDFFPLTGRMQAMVQVWYQLIPHS